MKVFILFFICFIITSAQSDCDEEWCIIKVLHERNAANQNLFEESKKHHCDDCESVVDLLKSSFLENVLADDNATCISDFFNEYRIADLYLKGRAYQKLNLSMLIFSNKSTDDALSVAKTFCPQKKLTEDDFAQAILMLSMGTYFDLHDYDESENRCIMKYLFENKITDLSEFTIASNEVNATECSAVVEEFENKTLTTIDAWTIKRDFTFYGISNKEFQVCLREELSNQKFFLNIATNYIASNLNLADDLKEKVRENFTKMMAGFNRSFYGCSQTILKM